MRYAIIENGIVSNLVLADEPLYENWVVATEEAEIGGTYVDGQFNPVTPAGPTKEEQEAKRQAAYTEEADPLFFKWQAGEATEAEWLAKREEIRARYPYPEVE